MKKNMILWVHGLGAALIGGAATALLASCATGKINRQTLITAGIGGIFHAAAYLAKSPLFDISDNADPGIPLVWDTPTPSPTPVQSEEKH